MKKMKINNLVRKFHQASVFTKLLFVMIVTCITIIIIIVGFIKYYSIQMIPFIKKNAINYAKYIIHEIGTPPDKFKALEITKGFSLNISFMSPEFRWTTNDKSMSFEEFDRITPDENGLNKTEFDEGKYFISVKQDSGRYLFTFDFSKGKGYKKVMAFLLLILLILVFFVAYSLIRRLLKPIKWLAEGVEKISDGDLKYLVRVQRWREDELGKLPESFNKMTNTIREMIRLKEQLLLDVSHELRSPLTRIKVALEYIPEGKKKESILEDLSEVEKMIEEILETQRLNSDYGKLNLRTVNVSEIIKDVLQYFQNKYPEINLTSNLNRVLLNIDIDRIKKVIKNILENALKNSKPESQPVEISIEKGEKFIVIRIKDYGQGIPEEDLPFIFEPFYRIDKSRSKQTGGYGLGMSLCKKIMEAHGGVIEIKSNLKTGTTIFLKFKK